MAGTDSTQLELQSRTPEGSRSTRRMRRSGLVPGVIYGGGGEPQHFSVDARILRNTLAHSGAVLEVTLEGGKDNVMVKALQRHPVRGEFVHVDFVRVNMNVAVHTTVTVELINGEDAAGVKEGGVLTQDLRDLNVEALPGDIPEYIQLDVTSLEINHTLHVSDLTAPQGVTILDDPEMVVCSVTPPTVEPVEEDLETETAVVGEDGDAAEAQADGATQDETAEAASDSDASE
jgi:large subunit ribosomal protein L25